MASKKPIKHGGRRKGAGRKPKPTSQVQFSVRLTRSLVKQLDREAAKTEKTRNDVIFVRLVHSYKYEPFED